jgi:8-oxo-dGTP pyrophosphatase MutT (NUDIX family)
VTRGFGPVAELCVFWHAGSGIQVSAGSIEDGETFEEGALREAFEETALRDLELVAYLGATTYDLTGDWSTLRRRVELRATPHADAEKTAWTLVRNHNVIVRERVPGFARVCPIPPPEPDSTPVVTFDGWVAAEDLYSVQERRFFHLRAPLDSPDKWRTLENGEHDLHLYWVPLAPKPTLLIESNQAWLDQFYDALITSVGAS